MGACVSQPEHVQEAGLPQQTQAEEEVTLSSNVTSSLSAFAAAAAQKHKEPDSIPVHNLQPALAKQPQPQLAKRALQARPVPILQHQAYRAAAVPDTAAAVTRISPWTSLDTPARVPAPAAAMQPVLPAGPLQEADPTMWRPASKEEHMAELMQLLEDACRDQSVDWKVLRGRLQKARSVDIPILDAPGPPQALNQDTPASSMLQMIYSGRHDSASSSIEPRRQSLPISPRTPKVPALGRMGTAGSLPVYSYQKPLPEPSCPDFLKMLSIEGRSAYAEWRGEGSEDGSFRGEDLSAACDAVITSLSSDPFDDWLEIGCCAKNQSLFCGMTAETKSPFDVIPDSIQRSMSSPADDQSVIPPRSRKSHRSSLQDEGPCTNRFLANRTHRSSSPDGQSPMQRDSRLPKHFSLDSRPHKQTSLDSKADRQCFLDARTHHMQSLPDGRHRRGPRQSSAAVHSAAASALFARPPLPRQATGH